MKHTLTFSDGKSNKFWSIEVKGNSYTVNYGKAGTDGQTQTKEFADEKACLNAAEKVMNEKKRKGYVEEGGSQDTAPAKPDKPAAHSVQSQGVKKTPEPSPEVAGEAITAVTGDRDHRQFVFRFGENHKFWNIERQGSELVISFGVWGKKARSNRKSYQSDTVAAREMVKAINKKTNEGYMETTPGAVPITELMELITPVPVPLNLSGFWRDLYDFGYTNEETESGIREYISWGKLGDVSEEVIVETIDAVLKNREQYRNMIVLAAGLNEQNKAIFTPELVKAPKKVEPITAPKGGKITKKMIKQMIDAITDDRVEDVRTLAGFGVTGNHADNEIFQYAVTYGNPEIIKLIVPTLTRYTEEAGCARDYHRTTTNCLLAQNSMETLKAALEAGYDLKKDPWLFENIGPVKDMKIADLVFSIVPLSADTEGKAMVTALSNYNEALVDYLLEHDANLNGYDNVTGDYVMHFVLSPLRPYCNLETVKRFVEKGAPLDVANLGSLDWYEMDKKPRTGGGETPLLNALASVQFSYQSKVPEEVEEYVRQRCNTKVPAGQAFKAAREGKLAIVKDFVEENGVDVRDENGATLLHHMMLQKDNTQNKECAEYLLSKGLDVNAVDNQGRNALFYVDIFTNYSGGTDIVGFLAEKGIHLDCPDNDGLSAIMFHTISRPERPVNEIGNGTNRESEYSGRSFALQSLTRAGADLNRQFRDGKNIFHYLLSLPTFFEDDEIIERMMKSGGDVNQKDNQGRSALHYATTFKYTGVDDRIDLYVKEGGADLNSQDNLGNTPLHTLLIDGDKYSIGNLLRNGADPTIKNNEGKTAEDLMHELGVYEKYKDKLEEFHAAPPEQRIIKHTWKPVEIQFPQTRFESLKLEIAGSVLLPKAENGQADSLFTAGENRIIGRDLHDRYTCIDSLTGQVLWQEKSYGGHKYAFYSEQDEVIYSGHAHKEVAAVDPETGEILWKVFVANSYSTFSSPFTEYKNLLIFHSRSSIYGVNKDTHKIQWKLKMQGNLNRYTCNVWNNFYIVRNTQGDVPCFFLVNMDSGTIDSIFEAEKGYENSRRGYVKDNMLWYLSEEGSVCRLDFETGEQEDVTLVTEYGDTLQSLVISNFNYVNGRFYFYIHLIHENGEENGLYSCKEDMRIERIVSSSGNWLFSGFKLHGTTLYDTLSGKIRSLSLDDFTEKELTLPIFSGMDYIDSNICIHDNTMFITQSGGNENDDRQILWQIE